MDAPDTRAIETDLLLEAIYRRYHYDFRNYARASLERGVGRAQAALGSPTLAHLTARVLHEPRAFAELLPFLTVQVSDLFREPAYFRRLRDDVLPRLATYPFPRVWVAGCGAGEEAYSIAILLHEAGLLERSLVYATDIDAGSLRTAEAGEYPLDRACAFAQSYAQAGGRASLADYTTTDGGKLAFVPRLRRRVHVFEHSLATDAAFAEVHLVSCRNVLIYFDETLRDRALDLFRDALCPRGFLGLGSQETLNLARHAAAFEAFGPDERIYRKT